VQGKAAVGARERGRAGGSQVGEGAGISARREPRGPAEFDVLLQFRLYGNDQAHLTVSWLFVRLRLPFRRSSMVQL
jgi:hypothetical protein